MVTCLSYHCKVSRILDPSFASLYYRITALRTSLRHSHPAPYDNSAVPSQKSAHYP